MGFLDPKPQTVAGLDAAVRDKINLAGSATKVALDGTYTKKADRPYVDVDEQKLGSDPDDTLSWQRAINLALASGVKRVLGRSPNYYVSAQIDCKNAQGLTIAGSGVGSTVINADGATAVIGGVFTSSMALNGLTFENMTVRGTVIDDVTVPRRSRTFTGNGFNSAFSFFGDNTPNNVGAPRMENITLRNVRIEKARGLPFFFNGVRGEVGTWDVSTYLTMDGGWVSCERVVGDNLRSFKSADNGFSISRSCKNVTLGSVSTEMAAYWGLWVSGFNVNGDTTDHGPSNVVIGTVNVKNVGVGGVVLDDAPRNVRIGNLLVDGVARGASDEPSSSAGLGIKVGGFPSTNRLAPTAYAENISVGSAVLMNCQRGGVIVAGAKNVKIDNLLVIDAGTQYKSDGTTVITSTDIYENFGATVDPAYGSTVSGLQLGDLRVVDTRATPYTNHPVTLPANTLAQNSGWRDVSSSGTRQTVDSGTLTQIHSGAKTFKDAVNLYRIYAAGSAASVAAGAQADAASAASNGARDVAGTINVTAKATGPAAGTLATVSFSSAYTTTPHMGGLVALNLASAQCQPYISARSTTSFTISCAVAPAASAALQFEYSVCG